MDEPGSERAFRGGRHPQVFERVARCTGVHDDRVPSSLQDVLVTHLADRDELAQPRRGLMQAALRRIAQAPGLSPDVTEVVTRTLTA